MAKHKSNTQQIVKAIAMGDIEALRDMDVYTLDEHERFRAIFRGFRHTPLVEYMIDERWTDILDNCGFWILTAVKHHPLSVIEQLCGYSTEALDEALVAAVKSNRSDVVGLVHTLLPLSNPKAFNSQALQWASVNHNGVVFDLLYPLSDPAVAIGALQKISTDPSDWVLLDSRINAERMRHVLHTQVEGAGVRERKM